MVITPDIPDLPFILRSGVKYFELIAEPVKQEILPGLYINGWGYNGSIPGPTILVYPGDRVSVRVTNRLPEATSVHWHGLNVPNRMDGVPEIEPSPKIEPNKYFDYTFTVANSPGTHMYHTHFNSQRQQMMGLGGAFIILNREKTENIQRDYFLMLQEFTLKGLKMGEVAPGEYDIDTMSHDFNFFTINGKCFPSISGHQFRISASDGNSIPVSERMVKNTVNVASGETYDVEFKADNPGEWPFHCHIPHHMSNNMQNGMGGMVTVISYK